MTKQAELFPTPIVQAAQVIAGGCRVTVVFPEILDPYQLSELRIIDAEGIHQIQSLGHDLPGYHGKTVLRVITEHHNPVEATAYVANNITGDNDNRAPIILSEFPAIRICIPLGNNSSVCDVLASNVPDAMWMKRLYDELATIGLIWQCTGRPEAFSYVGQIRCPLGDVFELQKLVGIRRAVRNIGFQPLDQQRALH